MKKLLFLLTVCVIGLPLRANTPPPKELCNDETFISLCNESIELAYLVKRIDNNVLFNEEALCLKESIDQRILVLNKTHHLFNNTSDSNALLKEAIGKVWSDIKIDKRVQENCFNNYMLMIARCNVQWPYPYLSEWGECIAAADLYFMVCSGIP